MDVQPSKLEIWGLRLFFARLKSKSPKNYATAVKIAVALASVAGGYVFAYNLGLPHTAYDHLLGQIDNGCILVTGMAATLGFTAGSNTKDPSLMDPSVKENVMQEAVNNGTHILVDTSNRGNDTN